MLSRGFRPLTFACLFTPITFLDPVQEGFVTWDCKWKEKVAALGRDTCRFLPRIARKVTLPITHPEEILAVIPKEEAIHCHHLGKYVTLPASPSGRINETGATHDQTP